jgi:hypothetical protein
MRSFSTKIFNNMIDPFKPHDASAYDINNYIQSHIFNTTDHTPTDYDSIFCNAVSDAEASRSIISRFDSNSFPLKKYNCCTKTISGYKDDFDPANYHPIATKVVKGFGDTLTTITHTGTIHWSITNDNNTYQNIIITGPGSNIRLLSPQH